MRQPDARCGAGGLLSFSAVGQKTPETSWLSPPRRGLHVWSLVVTVTLMADRLVVGDDLDQDQGHDQDQGTVDLSSDKKTPPPWGVEPGDAAAAFRVPTLDGGGDGGGGERWWFSYSPGALVPAGALVIHAFTHKSGFLEGNVDRRVLPGRPGPRPAGDHPRPVPVPGRLCGRRRAVDAGAGVPGGGAARVRTQRSFAFKVL